MMIAIVLISSVGIGLYKKNKALKGQVQSLEVEVSKLQDQLEQSRMLGGPQFDIDPRLIDRFIQKLRKPI